jgi:hypothetical protein
MRGGNKTRRREKMKEVTLMKETEEHHIFAFYVVSTAALFTKRIKPDTSAYTPVTEICFRQILRL